MPVNHVMKLLLTSSGVTSEPVKKSFLELIKKSPSRVIVAFIPTAGNPVKEEWYWELVKKDLATLKGMGFRSVIQVDISKVEPEIWKKQLSEADVIYIEGGNTFYLMDQIRKSGLDKELPQLLEKRTYVGVSAGSIVATPDISVASLEPPDENVAGLIDMGGLGLVDFEVCPHAPDMTSLESVKLFSKGRKWSMYTIADNSAVMVNDGEISFTGTGITKIDSAL